MSIASGLTVFQGVSLSRTAAFLSGSMCDGYWLLLLSENRRNGRAFYGIGSFFYQTHGFPIFGTGYPGEAITLNIGIGMYLYYSDRFVNLTDGDKLVRMFRLEKVFYFGMMKKYANFL